jgi:copper chaperone CopZ
MMKKSKLIRGFVLIAFLVTVISCGGNNKKAEQGEGVQKAALVEVSIGGMTCTGCEMSIQNKLSKLEGVTYVKASFTDGKAVVEYIPALTDTLKIREAVTATGYTCKNISTAEAR